MAIVSFYWEVFRVCFFLKNFWYNSDLQNNRKLHRTSHIELRTSHTELPEAATERCS